MDNEIEVLKADQEEIIPQFHAVAVTIRDFLNEVVTESPSN